MTTVGQRPTSLTLDHRSGDTAWAVTLTYTGATPVAATAELTDAYGRPVPGAALNAATVGQVVTLTVTGTVPLGRYRWRLVDSGLTHLAGEFFSTDQARPDPFPTSVEVQVTTGASVTVAVAAAFTGGGGGGGGGSMTAAEILTAVKTVDGAGSGLDADLLDGQHAAAFAAAAHTHGTLPLSGSGSPEGVVTATVGRTYTDESTGYQWSKITGTGNTGWQITNAIRNVTLDANGAGGEQYATGLGVDLIDATNGPRGDSIASDTALGAGATFGFGHYVNFTGADALAGPGAMHGLGVYGEIAADSRYGEAAAVGAVITNNRDGALAEGYEITITDTTGGGRNVGVGVIARMQAAVTRWFRGIWFSSQGSQAAGDAIYIDGPAGWTNFVVAKDTAGTTQFQVDASGNVTSGFTTTYGVLRRGDGGRFFAWFDGSPEGVVAASPGAVIYNTLGGSGTTIYYKATGTGNTGWVAVPSAGGGGGSMTGAEILAALATVDGAGSGLDADLLDGLSSAAFALVGHNHTGTYDPAGTASTAVAAHEADTTSVHGITDTTALLTKLWTQANAAGQAVELGDGTRAVAIWAEAGGPSIGSKDDSRLLIEAQARWDSDDDGAEGTGIDINKPAVVLRQTGEDHKGALIEMQQYLAAGTHTYGVATNAAGGTFNVAAAGYKRVGWILAHYDSPNPADGIHQHMNFETVQADLSTIVTRFQISWGEDIALASFPNSHVRFFDDKEVQFGSDKDVTLKFDTASGRIVATGATWRFGTGAASSVWIDVTNGRIGVGPAVSAPSAPLHLERTTSGTAILARNTDAAGSTGAIVKAEALTAGSRAFQAGLQADTVARFNIDIDGTHAWGPGGSTTRDTNLYRSAADTLKTDDNFVVGGTLTIGADPIAEVIRDTMATALVAGTNVTITPNDGADTITIAATGGGGGGSVAGGADHLALITIGVS